jgi:hypothetical protein
MVRELGLDAAEAGPAASAQAFAAKTAVANRIGVIFFIPEPLVLSAELVAIARAEIPRAATA